MSRFAVACAVVATLMMVALSVDGAVVAQEVNPAMNLTQYNALSVEGKKQFEMKFGNPWKWIECEICKKAMHAFESAIVDHGCGFADTAAAAACEAAGLGPLDIFSDLCVAALIKGCEIVAEDVLKHHITSSKQICKDIHMCH